MKLNNPLLGCSAIESHGRPTSERRIIQHFGSGRCQAASNVNSFACYRATRWYGNGTCIKAEPRKVSRSTCKTLAPHTFYVRVDARSERYSQH